MPMLNPSNDVQIILTPLMQELSQINILLIQQQTNVSSLYQGDILFSLERVYAQIQSIIAQQRRLCERMCTIG